MAAITVTGNASPIYDGSDPWVLTRDLRIGIIRDAHMTVTDGSEVFSEVIHVGVADFGLLQVEEGGRVTSRTGVIGTEETGYGSVFVDDPLSVWEILPDPDSGLGGDLYVGQSGSGEVQIGDIAFSVGGGTVAAKNAVMAAAPTSGGFISVIGHDSKLEIEQDLVIGSRGYGQLSAAEGGQISAGRTFLAAEPGSTAYVEVSGVNSTWTTDDAVVVGGYGQADATVFNGAQASASYTEIAQGPGSTGTLTITGAGSRWDTTTVDPGVCLDVGFEGDGILTISGGGAMALWGPGCDTYAGYAAGSSGTIQVTGAGSVLQSENDLGDLYLGYFGEGNLVVSEGGTVYMTDTHLGDQPGGHGTILVTGLGSALSLGNLGDLWVHDGSATISDAGQAWTRGAYIGVRADGPASVEVTDASSLLDSWELMSVGHTGPGQLIVANGGTVTTGSGSIGDDSAGIGQATVTGAGSVWENLQYFGMPGWTDGELRVGNSGRGSLTVSNGGRVADVNAVVAVNAGSIGSVSVTGADSIWQTAHDLRTGLGTATLNVSDGGTIEAENIVLGSGATVSGDGTLRANTVTLDGVMAPGNSIGTLTVDGDLVLDHDGVMEIEINNSGASDKVVVTGEFDMGGGAVKPIPTDTIVGTHQYTVIEANSVDWPEIAVVFGFDTVFLDSYVSQGWPEEPNSVFLHVEQVPFDDPRIARTDNERSLARALQQIAEQGGNDVTTALQQLQTADEARHSYDQLSGQTTTALAPVAAADTMKYMGVVSKRLRDPTAVLSDVAALPMSPAGTGPTGMATDDMLGVDVGGYTFAVGNGTPYLTDKPWAVWGRGYGLFGDRENEDGVPDYDYRTYGASFGFDYQFTERLLLGVTGGYSEGNIDYASSRDQAELSSGHGGLYGRYAAPRWYVDAIGTYAGISYETRRFVDLLGERLEGDPSGNLLSGYFEAGFDAYRNAAWLLQPLASFQISHLELDGYTESGGAGALAYDDQDFDSYLGSLGVRVRRTLSHKAHIRDATAELRARWLHEFGDTQSNVDAHFLTNPAAVFTISDSEISRDSAVLGAGLNVPLGGSVRAQMDYDVLLNPDKTDHVVSAALEYRW